MFDPSQSDDQKKYIDVDSGLARIRGNTAIYKKMLMLYLQSVEFDAFDEALAEQNLSRASEIAHAIKGMTGNLSLPLLFGISTKLMGQLREGELSQVDVAQYHVILKETRHFVEKVLESLN